jgi:hypothetical protein
MATTGGPRAPSMAAVMHGEVATQGLALPPGAAAIRSPVGAVALGETQAALLGAEVASVVDPASQIRARLAIKRWQAVEAATRPRQRVLR